MSNVLLPFLMSMILGRTIDLNTYTIEGQNVFDDADFVETPDKSLMTSYNVLQDDAIPYGLFGISADIVLRIKTNFLSSSSGALGLDGLLKDPSWKFNSAVVPFITLYTTVHRTLKEDAVPIEDWNGKVSKTQTHYAKSLFYGGWAVVLFRFKCDTASDVQYVRKVLTEHLGHLGNLDNKTQSNWEAAMLAMKKNQDIRGAVTLSTYVYSTMPFTGTINSPADLIQITDALPKKVGPVGQPLFMDVLPLHELDSSYPRVTSNKQLIGSLEKMDEMLDDVKMTKSNLMRWILETGTLFEEEDEERVLKLLDQVNECLRVFSEVCSEITIFKTKDTMGVDHAFRTYFNGLKRGIRTYNAAYRRLKEEIDAQCETNFLHKIKGLLRVYPEETVEMGMVMKGLKECKMHCIADDRCRSIGYADELRELDLTTGLYHQRYKQCWLYYRSTSTASINSPSGIFGDYGVYDRKCYY